MENQHRKISGYRELSAEEIELMNAIKAKAAEMIELQLQLVVMLKQQESDLVDSCNIWRGTAQGEVAEEELLRFTLAEPLRWANMGKTSIQIGAMQLVRAVAQPGGC